jgi:RNA polymerase sigma-70 factor (ECF subfamily)
MRNGAYAADLEDDELLGCIPHLRAFAWFLTKNRDRADVLVRDTIIRACQFDAETDLKVWMLTRLRTLHYEQMRKTCLHIHHLDDPLVYQPSVLPGEVASLEFGDFRRAFWQLADDRREALMLVGGAGLSYDQAARVGQCSTSTIKSRVLRGRRELLQILEDTLLADRRRDTPALPVYAGGIRPRPA